VTDYFQIGARRLAEEGTERAERARSDEIYLALRMQSARTRSVLETARKIAEIIPVQLKAANDAVSRARARYDSGLGTLTEVADAQRLLAQAEIDDLLARLAIWRTLSASARTHGDMEPFLVVASAQGGSSGPAHFALRHLDNVVAVIALALGSGFALKGCPGTF
jgi:outer membrane protein TolC